MKTADLVINGALLESKLFIYGKVRWGAFIYNVTDLKVVLSLVTLGHPPLLVLSVIFCSQLLPSPINGGLQ